MTNKNLPPLAVYVRDEFLFNNGKEHTTKTYGHLIGVRSLQNQALQFSVLLGNGSLFTGLPAHALCFTEESTKRQLNECQPWDNISSTIDVICYDTLRYMPCSVKLFNGTFQTGQYLFTIDYCGENDLSRHAIHWKQCHIIEGDDGNLFLYPQYRIRFLDKALCYDEKGELPNYSYNEVNWKCE
jgi:hypothetical protein